MWKCFFSPASHLSLQATVVDKPNEQSGENSDSNYASKASKLGYVINYGLGPYFKDEIMMELAPKDSRHPPK